MRIFRSLMSTSVMEINNSDHKISSDIIYLDFKKAFDSVPHKELLFKLWCIGITGPLWLWFRSYLCGRVHYTTVKNCNSSTMPVLSGVPQGSVLGPLVFLIYVNDLPSFTPNVDTFLFADDTKLLMSVETLQSQLLLQSSLNNVSHWCDLWNLVLNYNKCTKLTISLNQTYTLPVWMTHSRTTSKVHLCNPQLSNVI